MAFGVELLVKMNRVELLNFPGVIGTRLTLKDVVGPLLIVGETVAVSETLLETPRLPRITVVLPEPPAATPPDIGATLIVKSPVTVMFNTTKCFRAPLAPVTVTR